MAKEKAMRVPNDALGFISSSKGEQKIGAEGSDSENVGPTESEMLENLFAEIDIIDARIAVFQEETRRLEQENQVVLSELENIVSKL